MRMQIEAAGADLGDVRVVIEQCVLLVTAIARGCLVGRLEWPAKFVADHQQLMVKRPGDIKVDFLLPFIVDRTGLGLDAVASCLFFGGIE